MPPWPGRVQPDQQGRVVPSGDSAATGRTGRFRAIRRRAQRRAARHAQARRARLHRQRQGPAVRRGDRRLQPGAPGGAPAFVGAEPLRTATGCAGQPPGPGHRRVLQPHERADLHAAVP